MPDPEFDGRLQGTLRANGFCYLLSGLAWLDWLKFGCGEVISRFKGVAGGVSGALACPMEDTCRAKAVTIRGILDDVVLMLSCAEIFGFELQHNTSS